MNHFVALLILATTACSAAGADPAPVFTPSFGNVALDAELQAPLELAADRWIAATCLPISVNSAGVKWSLAHEPMMVETPEGSVAADGLTVPSASAPSDVFIADYVSDKDFAVAHEFGHRLGMEHNESTEEPDLMSPRRTVNRALGLRWSHISEQSLNAVCSIQDCRCFNPETGPVPL